MITYTGPRRLAMADEFVVLEEDLYAERALPGMSGRTTRILVGRAGQRVHRSKIPQGRFKVAGDDATVEDAIAAQAAAPTAPQDAPGAPQPEGQGDAPAGDATGDSGAPAGDSGDDSGNAPPTANTEAIALPEPPARNATTDAWRDYALAVEQATTEDGSVPADRTDAIMAATRDDLVAAYHPDGAETPGDSDG